MGVAPDAEVKAVAEAELRTFLIADIRCSTVSTTEHGADAAADLATRFAEIVREVVTASDGCLLELRGDETLDEPIRAVHVVFADKASKRPIRDVQPAIGAVDLLSLCRKP